MDPNYLSMMFPNGTDGSGENGGDYSADSIGKAGADVSKWAQYSSGVGGLAGGLMQMFMGGGNNNPANAAMQYYNKINGVNQQYLGPYNQNGQQAGNALTGQYSQLLSNPGQVFNNIGANFHQSPGFLFALHQALMSSNNAAAAGGMAGSPQNTQQNMSLATSLGNQDYYNYMQGATGLYGQGLTGEQGMYGTGAEAAGHEADNVSQALSMQALAAYLGQANANKAKSSAGGGIMGGLEDIGSAWAGAGFPV